MAKFRDVSDIVQLPPIPEHLVRDALTAFPTIIRSNASLISRLAKVYALIDRYNEFVATFAVCQTGCSHCCKIDVQINRLEAEFITKNTAFPLNNGISYSTGHTQACPFLGGDGACKIYQYRPLNCRTFHTLDDPKYCASGEDHQVYGTAEYGYGAPLYSRVAQWLASLPEARPYRDIRDWFPCH